MATQMTKSQLIEQIATTNELAKKDVKGVIETLAEIGYKELKKNGVFLVPGFAKFVVIKKPATKARKGTNPFTGEAMTFKAKPARKIVRARPPLAFSGERRLAHLTPSQHAHIARHVTERLQQPRRQKTRRSPAQSCAQQTSHFLPPDPRRSRTLRCAQC